MYIIQRDKLIVNLTDNQNISQLYIDVKFWIVNDLYTYPWDDTQKLCENF